MNDVRANVRRSGRRVAVQIGSETTGRRTGPHRSGSLVPTVRAPERRPPGRVARCGGLFRRYPSGELPVRGRSTRPRPANADRIYWSPLPNLTGGSVLVGNEAGVDGHIARPRPEQHTRLVAEPLSVTFRGLVVNRLPHTLGLERAVSSLESRRPVEHVVRLLGWMLVAG